MSPDLELIDGGDPVRQQAAAWFARLRADDVTGTETRRWQSWLDADPRHRAAYERLERLWSQIGDHAPHPEIARRLRCDVPTGHVVDRPAWRRWPGVAAAAVLVVAAIGSWGLLRAPLPLDTVYATAIGEYREVTLEDGTRVTLDTDTRLRVAYRDDERTMFLDQGRAFFRVAKERRPLSVQTTHGGLRVVGTEFEMHRREHALDVALLEGEVLLLPLEAGDGQAGPLLGMVAGQKAHFDGGRSPPRIESLRDPTLPAWLSGRLVFEDASLGDVVAEFNRYSHDRIVLEGDSLSAMHVTGVFRSDAPLAFVGALCDLYPIAADASTPGVVRLRTESSPRSGPRGQGTCLIRSSARTDARSAPVDASAPTPGASRSM